MSPRRLTAVAAFVLAVAPLAACGKDDDGKDGAATSAAVQVTATDTACELGNTALAAGATTFTIKNTGAKTTEVYVYGADGEKKFTKVVSEVENIGPGTSRDMKVDLAAGTYEVACKPGQKGDGIRATITVTGEGGAIAKPADRDVEFSTSDYTFAGLAPLAVKRGETITFEMVNKGPAEHEFEVLGPDGVAIGEIGPTKPGARADVTFTFDSAGTYTYQCAVDDHLSRGMKGTFTVS